MTLARRLTESISIVPLFAVIGCSGATWVEVAATPHTEATVEAPVKAKKAPQSAPTTAPTSLVKPTVIPSPTLRPKARGQKAVPAPTLQPMVRGQKDPSIEVTVYNPAKA